MSQTEIDRRTSYVFTNHVERNRKVLAANRTSRHVRWRGEQSAYGILHLPPSIATIQRRGRWAVNNVEGVIVAQTVITAVHVIANGIVRQKHRQCPTGEWSVHVVHEQVSSNINVILFRARPPPAVGVRFRYRW